MHELAPGLVQEIGDVPVAGGCGARRGRLSPRIVDVGHGHALSLTG
jgi:hypothetical protein